MMIKISDTTLRDGEQMPGVNINIGDKVRLALLFERLGIDSVEAGFPAASPNDFKAAEKIAASVGKITVAALARANISDIDIAFKAIKNAKHPRLHVFIATSDIHLEHKLNMTRESVINRIAETVAYAKNLCADVQFSPEDATRSDFGFLKKSLDTAINAGANVICIPDTVGYSNPDEYGGLIARIKKEVIKDRQVELSAHCHNDLGLAVANTLSALINGATRVECTINGLGERAGNCSFEELVMALQARKDYYNFETGINTELISQTSQTTVAITGVRLQPNKPIVGKNVFSHESGIHQHGVINDRSTYEIMKPESIGLPTNKIVLGRLSGSHAFNNKLKELNIDVESDVSSAAFTAFKDLACRKTNITDDDIRALVEEAILFSHIENRYKLDGYQTSSGNNVKATAVITLSKESKTFIEAAVGEGPIDAAFNAINRIVSKDYILIAYEIKAVTGGTDALGEVLVRISDGVNEFSGKGVSTDIIESSIKAYVNAINIAEYKK